MDVSEAKIDSSPLLPESDLLGKPFLQKKEKYREGSQIGF